MIMAGTSLTPQLCVDNWDTVIPVRQQQTHASIFIHSVVCSITIARAVPTRVAYFGEGSGPIHLSKARCNSHEKMLTNCNIDKTGINHCNHGSDAGVICKGKDECAYIATANKH